MTNGKNAPGAGGRRNSAPYFYFTTTTPAAELERSASELPPAPAVDRAELERAGFWARVIMLIFWAAIALPILGLSAGIAVRLFLWIAQI